MIGQAVSEKKIFEIVDDGRTDDGRTTDGRRTDWYTINSPCEPSAAFMNTFLIKLQNLFIPKEDFYPSSKIRFDKRLTIYLSYSHIPMLPFQIFGPPLPW